MGGEDLPQGLCHRSTGLTPNTCQGQNGFEGTVKEGALEFIMAAKPAASSKASVARVEGDPAQEKRAAWDCILERLDPLSLTRASTAARAMNASYVWRQAADVRWGGSVGTSVPGGQLDGGKRLYALRHTIEATSRPGPKLASTRQLQQRLREEDAHATRRAHEIDERMIEEHRECEFDGEEVEVWISSRHPTHCPRLPRQPSAAWAAQLLESGFDRLDMRFCSWESDGVFRSARRALRTLAFAHRPRSTPP